MNLFRTSSRVILAASLLMTGLAGAQENEIKNWAAPPYWAHPSPSNMATAAFATAGEQSVAALPSPPLPFVAIAPCRVADTRSTSTFTGQYGPPAITGGGTQRSFTIVGQCGIPADAQAVSFNFTVWAPLTRGDLRVFPTGGVTPAVSTLNWEANILALANAAVVPIGTGGDITVQVDGPGTVNIFFDVNGYYSPLGVVNSLNTLSGAVLLAAGTNVTITPSGNTLTLDSAGAVGATGATGATGASGTNGTNGINGATGATGAGAGNLGSSPIVISTVPPNPGCYFDGFISAPPCPLYPFIPPVGFDWQGAQRLTEIDNQMMIAAPCTANIGARVDVVPGVAITFTLRVNGITTSTFCTIETDALTCFSSAGRSIAAGDLVTLGLTGTTFGNATHLWVAMKCQ